MNYHNGFCLNLNCFNVVSHVLHPFRIGLFVHRDIVIEKVMGRQTSNKTNNLFGRFRYFIKINTGFIFF